MTDNSIAVEPSPPARRVRTPSWFDLRLVLGIALVLLSVLGGAAALSAAGHRQTRWAVVHDLSAGTVLSREDLRPVRVQLGASDGQYLPVTEPVVGKAISVPVRAGQLLARSVLTTPAQGVAVSISLPSDNGPAIARGDRITLYLSTKTCQGQVLLSGMPVQSVSDSANDSFGSDIGSVLVLTLPGPDARRVVAALDLNGAVIRAGVLAVGQPADPISTDLTSCEGTGS